MILIATIQEIRLEENPQNMVQWMTLTRVLSTSTATQDTRRSIRLHSSME